MSLLYIAAPLTRRLLLLWPNVLDNTRNKSSRSANDSYSFTVQHFVSDAIQLSSLGIEYDAVISILGNPYNTTSFWHAVKKPLIQNGTVLFTAPAYDWATTYRKHEGSLIDQSMFELQRGDKVYLPSYILEPNEQVKLIESAGLKVKEHRKSWWEIWTVEFCRQRQLFQEIRTAE